MPIPFLVGAIISGGAAVASGAAAAVGSAAVGAATAAVGTAGAVASGVAGAISGAAISGTAAAVGAAKTAGVVASGAAGAISGAVTSGTAAAVGAAKTAGAVAIKAGATASQIAGNEMLAAAAKIDSASMAVGEKIAGKLGKQAVASVTQFGTEVANVVGGNVSQATTKLVSNVASGENAKIIGQSAGHLSKGKTKLELSQKTKDGVDTVAEKIEN